MFDAHVQCETCCSMWAAGPWEFPLSLCFPRLSMMSPANARMTDISRGQAGVLADFSYSVKWSETSVPFERRMEKYSRYSFLPQHLEVCLLLHLCANMTAPSCSRLHGCMYESYYDWMPCGMMGRLISILLLTIPGWQLLQNRMCRGTKCVSPALAVHGHSMEVLMTGMHAL